MTMHSLEFKDAGDEDGGNDAGEVSKALAEFKSALDDRLNAVETKSNDDDSKFKTRLDRMEAKLNRPGLETKGEDTAKLETKAFVNFARRGVERMDELEKKTLLVSTDTSGGYLAPPEFGSELIKLLIQHSPIRQYARVVQIGGSSVKYPRRTASTTATWVGEVASRTESEPAFEQIAITPFELGTYTDVSTQLLEDNSYNLEGELLADFAEQFGKAEGAAFVNGTGSGQPKGIMNASGIYEVTTGNAANFPTSNPADVLIGVFHKLPGVHAQRGTWVMNRNTLAAIRKFKDAQGRYLVLDGLVDGAPVTLLGRPVVEAIDMPDIAADAHPILFGDLQGFRIVDRVGLSVLRDPYSLAANGEVRFHARKRVGSDVTHPDRFVKLKCAV